MGNAKPTYSQKSAIPVAVVVFLILVLLGTFLAMQTVKTFVEVQELRSGEIDERTIVAEGSGTVESAPTQVTVTLGVETERDSATEAQTANTETMNKITEEMKSLGIADEDMQTENYSLYRREVYNPQTGEVEKRGWVVSQSLVIETGNFDALPNVLTKATELGVTNVYGPNFAFEDATEVKAEAREIAIQRARAQAEVIAQSLGVKVGRVIDYEESSNNDNYPVYGRAEMSDMAAGSGPKIQQGSEEVTVNVYVTFELK